jgi:hypothetical protein
MNPIRTIQWYTHHRLMLTILYLVLIGNVRKFKGKALRFLNLLEALLLYAAMHRNCFLLISKTLLRMSVNEKDLLSRSMQERFIISEQT